MAWVERLVTRTTQPQGPCELNRFWAPKIIGVINAAFLVEEVAGTQLILSGTTPVKTPTQLGLSIAGNGSGIYYSQKPNNTIETVIGCTLVTVGTMPAASNVAIGGFGENANIGGVFTSAYDTTIGRVKTFFRGRAGGQTTERAYIQSGALSGVFVSRISAANNIDVWLDGQPSNGTVPLSSGTDNNLWSRLSIGGAMRNTPAPAAASGTRSLLTAVLRNVTLEEAKALSENPWQIYEPEVQRIWVDDYVSAGGGGPTLTAPLLTNSSTLFAPAVTPAAVSATAPLLTNSSTLFAPTISAGGTGLTAPLLASVSDFFAPAVTPGAVSLSASLFTNAGALYTPAIVNGIVVSPPYFENANSFYSPTITRGAVALAAALFTNTSTVFPARIVIAGDELTQILQILTNRQELNPATGMFVLYDDDGVSVLKTAMAWEDAAGTIPYRGQALRRLDALQ